jgi:hypothetical protein
MVDLLVGLGGLLELGDELVKLGFSRDDLVLGGGVFEPELADADDDDHSADEGEEGREDEEGVGVVAVARDAIQVDAEQADDDGEEQPAAPNDSQVVLHAEALLLQLLPDAALHHVLHGEQAVAHRVLLAQHLPRLLLHLLQQLQRALLLQMRHELVQNLLPRVQRPLGPDHLRGKVPNLPVQNNAQQRQILLPFPAKKPPPPLSSSIGLCTPGTKCSANLQCVGSNPHTPNM